jgi:hypothetical protein
MCAPLPMSSVIRSEAAQKAWVTRRKKAEAKEQKLKKLSNRAIKAWETRKTKKVTQNVKNFDRHCAALKAWSTRRKNQSLQAS